MTFEEKKKAVSFVLLTDIRRYLVRLPLTLEPERPHQATLSYLLEHIFHHFKWYLPRTCVQSECIKWYYNSVGPSSSLIINLLSKIYHWHIWIWSSLKCKIKWFYPKIYRSLAFNSRLTHLNRVESKIFEWKFIFNTNNNSSSEDINNNIKSTLPC